ncbi:hypothetical protein [Rubrivirga sp.]|uniref:hypothetical protein n=1 Tax=Rubrivirga sp. TaxID=1885344 RepID=UPI003C73BD08
MPDVLPDRSSAPRVVVGIDPGSETGLATVDAQSGAVLEVAEGSSEDFHGAPTELREGGAPLDRPTP